MILSLWAYRGFVLSSVAREFQAKYRYSMLGAAWTILNPLALVTVYAVVFSGVMQARLPGVDDAFAYSIYLCAGVLAWGLFTEITLRGQTVFIENANLIKKLSFPRLCLPVIVVIGATINFAIVFGLFLLFMLLAGHLPGLPLLGLLPVLVLQIAFAAGLGVVLGVLNVFFRDVGQFFGIVLQFWFWLTPIVYPATVVPARLRELLALNPLTPLIGAYQEVLVHGRWPDWGSLVPVAAIAVLLCLLAMRLFRARAAELADEL